MPHRKKDLYNQESEISCDVNASKYLFSVKKWNSNLNSPDLVWKLFFPQSLVESAPTIY